MARAARPSLEQLSAAIEAIHSAAVDSSCWPDVLGQVGGFFRASMVTLWGQDAVGGYHDIGGTERYGAITRAYAEYYGRLDLVHQVVLRAGAGSIFTDAMVVPRSELERTEFFSDFADRHSIQFCLEARVTERAEGDSFVTMTRSNGIGSFDAEEVRLMRLLLPHVRDALRTNRRLTSTAAECTNALAALDALGQGVIILDSGAHVLHANPVAAAMLRAADGLTTARGELRATERTEDAALRRALAEATSDAGTTLTISRLSGRAALVVNIQPLSANTLPGTGAWQTQRTPAALVFVVDPDQNYGAATLRALRSAYGLTAAEAAAAAAVARGLGAQEASEALRVAPSTLRWHLQRVFEKTGTMRQAELARLVARVGLVAGEG